VPKTIGNQPTAAVNVGIQAVVNYLPTAIDGDQTTKVYLYSLNFASPFLLEYVAPTARKDR
jgi:hypothetical protein